MQLIMWTYFGLFILIGKFFLNDSEKTALQVLWIFENIVSILENQTSEFIKMLWKYVAMLCIFNFFFRKTKSWDSLCYTYLCISKKTDRQKESFTSSNFVKLWKALTNFNHSKVCYLSTVIWFSSIVKDRRKLEFPTLK